MNKRFLATVVGATSLAFVLVFGARVRTQETPGQPPPPANGGQQDGVEVLARGPVHEAFAEPTVRGPRPTPVVPKKAPDPIEELPPDQKPDGNNVQWIPGYWAWDEDRNDFLWVSGIWRDIPPGQQWVPGHWETVDDGSQWVAGYWAPLEQATAEFLPQPPDPIQESEGVAPNANNVYVPGTWVWRDRYLWRPGFWMGFRPGWVWIPAHYVWTPAGYIFVDGHWDYPFANRGLLFAPVVFAPGYWNRPNWYYRPYYAVSDTFLMGALFVRPFYASYYFGDYFDPRYNRLGFSSWVDFRIGDRFYDPNLSYYRWQNRSNPSWMRDLRQVYVARQNGDLPRPPRTLLQQNTFVQNNRNIAVNSFRNTNITNIRNITNVTALASLPQVKQQGVGFQRLTADQVTRERKDAQRFRSLGQDRAKLEARVRSQGSPLTSGNETTGPVRMDFPGLKATTKPSAAVRGAPPLPNIPNPRPHDAATEGTRRPAETINPRGTRTGAGEERKNMPGKDAGRPAPERPARPEPRGETIKPRDEGKAPPSPAKPKPPPPETRKAPPPEPKKAPPSESKSGPPPRAGESKKAPPPEHKPAPKPNKDKPPDK
jgi:hypothetical protein